MAKLSDAAAINPPRKVKKGELVAEMTRKGVVPGEATEAVSQFLKEFEMLKAGKNPEGLGAFDE